jgi:REP element-mobilizing transposase RayT
MASPKICQWDIHCKISAMKFDPKIHHRASTRLPGFDYSLAGGYFITLVTFQREMLFGEIVDGTMKLNRRGGIVQEEWFRSAEIRKEIRLFLDEFVVMPNHIHGIVWIVDGKIVIDNNVGTTRHPDQIVNNNIVVGADGRPPLPMPSRKPRSLGSFVAGFKSSVTKRIREELGETGIWQRNYHDRIIRNERELDAIRKYIETNPYNWAKDEENISWGK